MLGQIKGKSLDKLEELITRFSQKQVKQAANNKHNKDLLNKAVKVRNN
jgi:hypothetical protein